jgi:putative ABC transport system permease protein
MELLREHRRGHAVLRAVEAVGRDVRDALRTLRRTPAFSIIAIATLALGVGIITAVFSVISAVMLRPLPYAEPDRLVSVWEIRTRRGERLNVSPADLADYRGQTTSFADMAGYALVGKNLTEAGVPERLWVQQITPNLFSVLGVNPALGRGLRAEEDQPGKDHVVILSHALWVQRFGVDPNIVGRMLRLNGEPYEVVGVMPEAFKPPTQYDFDQPISLLIPVAQRIVFDSSATEAAQRGARSLHVVARLKPGISVERARSDLRTVADNLAQIYPDTNREIAADLRSMQDDITGNVRTGLMILLGAVGIVWLVACVNVANLLIVRAISRQREIAIRLGLGASLRRVMLGFVIFGLVLSLIGCVVGVLLGVSFTNVVVRLAPPHIPRLEDVSLDWRVLTVVSGLSLLAGALFGLLPIWQVSRTHPADVLKLTDRGTSGVAILRWRSLLVAVEIASCAVLLVGGGLLLNSFIRLSAVDLGFEPKRVLALNVNLPDANYNSPERRLAFFEQLTARVQTLPGVVAVGYANRLPLRGGWGGNIIIEHPQSGEIEAEVDLQGVSPGYFDVLSVSMVRGRSFDTTDRADSLPACVVSYRFAQRFFSGLDPTGRRLRRPQTPWMTIVGVVGDIRRGGKTAALSPQVYFPAAQIHLHPITLSDIAVRTAGDPRQLVKAIQSEVWAIDKDQPVTNVKTLDEIVAVGVAPRRFQTMLLLLFAGVALVLALVGTYGVMSYAVERRTAEIGVRVALGAKPTNILTFVLAQAIPPIMIGLTVGLAGAYALSRYVRGLLFDVEPTDPSTFAFVTLLLCVAAFAACYVPARRAMRIMPAVALRYE